MHSDLLDWDAVIFHETPGIGKLSSESEEKEWNCEFRTSLYRIIVCFPSLLYLWTLSISCYLLCVGVVSGDLSPLRLNATARAMSSTLFFFLAVLFYRIFYLSFLLPWCSYLFNAFYFYCFLFSIDSFFFLLP